MNKKKDLLLDSGKSNENRNVPSEEKILNSDASKSRLNLVSSGSLKSLINPFLIISFSKP